MSSLVEHLQNEHKARRARLAAAAVEDSGIDLKRKPRAAKSAVARAAARADRAASPAETVEPPPPPPPDPIRDWLLTATLVPEYIPRHIIEAVCKRFHIHVDQLKSECRTHNVVRPRQLCMYLLRRFTTLSYPRIAAAVAAKITLLPFTGIKLVEARLAVDIDLKRAIHELILQLELEELAGMKTRHRSAR